MIHSDNATPVGLTLTDSSYYTGTLPSHRIVQRKALLVHALVLTEREMYGAKVVS